MSLVVDDHDSKTRRQSVQSLGVALASPFFRRTTILLFAVGCLIIVLQRSPLGWDESVYAARAKDLVASEFTWGFRSGVYWSDVRAPGLPMMQSVAFQVFGVSDLVARSVVVAFATGFLVLVGRTLDLWFDRRVGSTAVLLIATSPGFIATSTLSFADVPAVFLGLVAVYSLAWCYVNDREDWLFLVPVFIGIATAVRFGAVLLVLAPLVLIAFGIGIRLVRLRNWRRLLSYLLAGSLTGGIVVVLLWTRVLTTAKSPIVATRSLHVDSGYTSWNWWDDLLTILRPGPVDYGFGGAFWGWSYALTFGALALMAVVRLIVGRHLVLLTVCGVVSVVPVLLYAVTVNQFVTTYLAPIFAMWAAMVAIGLWPRCLLSDSREEVPDELAPRWLAVFGVPTKSTAVKLALAVFTLVLFVLSARSVSRMHDRLWGFEQVRAASIISDDLLGEDCRLSTARTPQVSWYSDCYVSGLPGGAALFAGGSDQADLDAIGAAAGAEPGELVGLLLLDGLRGQPAIDDIWHRRVVDSSVLLSVPSGRRVAVVALEVP